MHLTVKGADNVAEQNQKGNRNRAGAGGEMAEGAAMVGGGAAGAAMGSFLGPLGTVAGAVAGGAAADEAVENAQAGNQGQGRGAQNKQGQ